MRKTTLALGLAAFTFAVMSAVLWQRVEAGRAAVQAQQVRITALEDRSRRAGRNPVAPPMSWSQSPTVTGTDATAPEAITTGSKGVDINASGWTAEYRRARVAQTKARFRAGFKDFRDWVQMSDEKFEEFLALSAQQSVDTEELSAAIRKLGRTEEHGGQIDEMQRNHVSEMEQIFDPEARRQWHDWRYAGDARQKISTLNGQLTETGRLSPKAAREVATAMGRARKEVLTRWDAAHAHLPVVDRNDATARIGELDRAIERIRLVREGTIAAASSYLSPGQLQTLESVLQTDDRDWVAALKVQRERLKAVASAPVQSQR